MTDDFRKYLCEFIGTFTLVLFAAGAVVVDGLIGGGIGIIGSGLISGLVITVVIYAFGHVSGAHVNPALTLASCLIGRFPKRLLFGYICAQMTGSAIAGMLLLWTLGDFNEMGANLPRYNISQFTAVLLEFLLAFLLMWVIAGVGLDKRAHGPFAGVTIGALVGIEVMVFGSVSGAAMNPARAFGPYIAMGSFEHYWIYVVGPIFGMVAGAYTYQFTHRLKDVTKA